MPSSGPRDRIVYPTLKVMIDSYNDVQLSFLSGQISAVFGDNKVDGITRKPVFRVFRPDPTKTSLYSHRRWLEA